MSSRSGPAPPPPAASVAASAVRGWHPDGVLRVVALALAALVVGIGATLLLWQACDSTAAA